MACKITMTMDGVKSSVMLSRRGVRRLYQIKTPRGVMSCYFSAKPVPGHENGVICPK